MTKEIDPVVDKSLEEKAEICANQCSFIAGIFGGVNRQVYDCVKKSTRAAYIQGAKESKSTAIADFILKLQERCWDHVRHSEGRLVNHDNPEEAWGEQMTANDLLKYAEELKDKI